MIGLQCIMKIKNRVKFFLKQFLNQKVVLNTKLLSKECHNKTNSYNMKLTRLSNKFKQCNSNRCIFNRLCSNNNKH